MLLSSHKTNVSYCKCHDAWNQFIVGTDGEIVMVLEVYCILIIFCSCITGSRFNNATSISYNVKILNMNVWGIRYYSERKNERMEAIYKFLMKADYDIVFLQELWSFDDYKLLRQRWKKGFWKI